MTKISSLYDLPITMEYLNRINAEPRSLRRAVVKQQKGNKYWKDIAVIAFEKDGRVTAPELFLPTPQEAEAIILEFVPLVWPSQSSSDLFPQNILDYGPQNIYVFRDTRNQVQMVEVRTGDVDKAYRRFTYWDDDVWREAEPDGSLPLWGMEFVKDNTTIFVHEGAKAARAMHIMANDPALQSVHPWGKELANAAHIGWTGGALSPHRTDWSHLKKMGVRRAYIVSDNDAAGKEAVPAISDRLNIIVFHLQFTDQWPKSFDLADQWPDNMFTQVGGIRHYIGPTFMECLHPATYATTVIAPKKGPNGGEGKPQIVLRDHFKEMWTFIEDNDIFACLEIPGILQTESVLNKGLSSFSNSSETSKLITKTYSGRIARLCYRPDFDGLILTDKGTSALNLHIKTPVASIAGDPTPWLDFLEYLVPKPDERHQLMRWCATLIARPDIKMEYGVLMASEHQGIGKTTLGASILAPLVGVNNAGYPSENDIVSSNFNDWIANKRLVIVNEIYSGHSWKAYNKLKGYITDRDIYVNIKYQKGYTVENWAHMFACSNSLRALRMEADDRRWFYPEITEVAWGRDKFVDFHTWLASGGLGIIKSWAENFKDYVLVGQRAPMTKRKTETIEESKSRAQQEVEALAETICMVAAPVSVTMGDIKEWLEANIKEKIFDSDHELRKAMKSAGVVFYSERVRVNGKQQYIALNSPATVTLAAEPDKIKQYDLIRTMNKTPTSILMEGL